KLIVFHRGKVDVFDTSYDEFLEKIGWEDEDQGHGKANGVQKKPTTRSHHDEKKQRAKVERKEKARIEKLEAQIVKNETALKNYNEQLVLEANRNNLGQMRELSVKISQVKREIDDLYGQYSE
ncbi:MAG: ABC transporter C-terminal domain-containing protein, partial [Candidatus Binatia bacterium]